MTAFATVSSAIYSLRAGAYDYIQKPFSMEELTEVLENAHHQTWSNLTTPGFREDSPADSSLELFGDRSPEIEKIRRIIPRIAIASHPVMIIGEPGSGKETLARSMHLNSSAASKPFVSLNCSTLSSQEIDDLLFGEASGGDTGVTGALTSERGGTVFLNEIGDLAPALQLKLTRVLEEKTVRLPSSLKTIPVTARILSASGRSLEDQVSAGHFRKDLFLRLNVVRLYVPPLRQRKPEIPRLAARILNRLSTGADRHWKLGRNVTQQLMRYDWPGNLKELQNALEYACLISNSAEVNLSDLPQHIQDCDSNRMDFSAASPYPEAEGNRGAIVPMAEVERNVIFNAIRQLDGDKVLAAAMLGIGKTTLYRKLKEYETTNTWNS